MKKSWKERFEEAYKANQAAHKKRLDPNQTDPEEAKKFYRKMGALVFVIGCLAAAFTIALVIFEGVIYFFSAALSLVAIVLGVWQMITGKPPKR